MASTTTTISTDPSSLLLSVSILACTYLCYQCFTPPNPDAKPISSTKPEDRANPIVTPWFTLIRRYFTIVAGSAHALLCIIHDPPSYICPRYQNVNQTLFTWNPLSISCISLILIFGPIRLLAFSQLGPNFTFRLAKPKKLIDTGLYHYVQHPSYTALAVLAVAIILMLGRLDAVMACWLPTFLVRAKYLWMVVGVVRIGSFGYLRVRDEEKMLRETFGEEWEVYHARTARFIPGLF